ncbi:MAG: ATP-binding cassette domain-containing protein [Spirochaetales bacterium]|nr:ATP-binding cassette domain-containing protein [Spirochaetales bacterium]
MKNIIEVKSLSKIFPGKITAVNKISFSVKQGEIFGFLGPNGAGKSTTIMMLTTLHLPSSGTAFVSGYEIKKSPRSVRMQFGYVSQDLAVDDRLTGYENLFLQAKYYHIPNQTARERIKILLNLVELEKRAKDLVETYSGGMRKRLDIACGLIHRPKILFLDEPTLGLDIHTRRQIWQYITDLREKQGITIFLTTHYMDEADSLCDRIAIIDHGVIKVLGTPQELKSRLGGDIITLDIALTHVAKIPRLIKLLKTLTNIKQIKTAKTKITIVTLHAESMMADILKIIQKNSIPLEMVMLKTPSLDDVFLNFTGRSLRDEAGNREQAHKARRMLRRIRS